MGIQRARSNRGARKVSGTPQRGPRAAAQMDSEQAVAAPEVDPDLADGAADGLLADSDSELEGAVVDALDDGELAEPDPAEGELADAEGYDDDGIDLDGLSVQCNSRDASIRRAIEERREARRLRDDLDYLDFDD